MSTNHAAKAFDPNRDPNADRSRKHRTVLPGAFCVYVSFLADSGLRGHESANFLFWEPLSALAECDIAKCSFHDYG